MNQHHRLFFSKYRILLCATALLLVPALLVNLGLVAFYGDEGIRSLVALEMQISGNYITPTMFGEFYYNKPPLYNWILLAVFEITGRSDEFIARLTTIFFLLAYVASVFFIVKKQRIRHPLPHQSAINNQQSTTNNQQYPNFPILISLALLTCGRILFWDSMLAYIDLCFSWVVYLLFMVIFREGERGRYGPLFGWAYGLAAVGFLLKGLPAVVFLGIALPTYFFWQKKGRKLASWAHLGGMAIFLVLVGGYYACYARQNGLEVVFRTLFDESAKRTIVGHGLGKTALHFLTFPFEMWYHFLPWSLLAVYFLRKNALRLLLQNKFVAWNGLVFLTTILPYWLSVEVYPRYLLMHVPLVFTVLFYLYFENKKENAPLARWVEAAFFTGCGLALAAGFAPLFWEAVRHVPFLYAKTALLVASLSLLTWLYWRWKAQRMLVFVLVMLVVRLGFNWFVLPTRLDVECSTKVRQTTLDAMKKIGDRPLFIYKNSLDGQPVTGYYFTRETGSILRNQYSDFDKNAFYLMDTTVYTRAHEAVAKVNIIWQCGELAVVKIK
ncbi:MAG: hypothetical protein HY842_01710 [Bacteroidetes bacterium]|nr:hypothetical protein [Bacteroidota bacterium]